MVEIGQGSHCNCAPISIKYNVETLLFDVNFNTNGMFITKVHRPHVLTKMYFTLWNLEQVECCNCIIASISVFVQVSCDNKSK